MKNYYLLVCLALCTFLSSCDEDEKEAIPPVVTIDSPNASTKLKRKVIISATATDDSGISSVQILVDETVVHDSGTGEVSFEWDTETVSNGTHTITVAATDAVGNNASESLTVDVFNDNTSPLVTITSPSVQPFIKSTVTIEGSVVDDSALESIKIFAGDVLLTTITTGNSFAFNWDTKTIADGNHTIKVTAIDNQGNESSATKVVKVFNYFTTLNFTNPVVPSHVKIWYMISKYDGTLIGTKPYVAGENKIRFETPDNFNPDERYLFSTFVHTDRFNGFYAHNDFHTEVGFKSGEISLSPGYLYSTSNLIDPLGFHTVKIDNVPAYDNLFVSGVSQYSSSPMGNALHLKFAFYDFNSNNLNPTIALLRTPDEAPRFKKYTGLQIDGVTETNFNDFTPMVGNKILAHPDAVYTAGYVLGVTASNYNEASSVWSYTGFVQSPKAHYLYNPPTGYPEYIYSAQEGNNTEVSGLTHVGAQAPTTFVRLNAGVTAYTKSQRTMTLETNGVYDFCSLSGSISTGTGDNLTIYFWSVQFADGAKHSFTLPQLPSAVAAYNFPDIATINFTSANFFDYSGFNSYQAMRDFQLANPTTNLYTVSKDFLFRSYMMPSSGGRIKNDAITQTLRLTMEHMNRIGLIPKYSIGKFDQN